MGPIKILVVAEPLERDGLRAAAAAAGGVAVGAEAHDDLAQVVASARADAVVLAGGVRDPAATARRLRALAGARTPIVFVGEPAEVVAVERLVDASFHRPTDASKLISRAIALTVAATAPPPPVLSPAEHSRLGRVAASIDEAINAEMLSALRTVDDPSPPRAPALKPPAESAALGGTAMVPPAALDDDLWGLAGAELPAPGGAPLAGTLTDVDAALLLGRIFNAGTTGRLVVEAGGVERVVCFEAGRPVYAASNSADDRLIAMLARQGRLTPAQHQTAVQTAKHAGRKMGALLVDLGALAAGELLPAIRQHYEELISTLFAASEGSWRLEPGVMVSPAQIRLLRHPAALVRDAALRCYPPERIWARLGSPRNLFAIELEGRGPDVVAALATGVAERRMPMLFDGIRPLGEVVRLSGLTEEAALATALTLLVFGLLRPATRTTAAVRDRELERERILARYSLVQEGDYFEVLGVGRGVSADEIRRAHDLVLRDLAPGRLGAELSRALDDELTTIREVLEEALRVLADDRLRARYEAHLPRLAERPAARG
jgi:DNA-binding NarL/FixJ family response regulator